MEENKNKNKKKNLKSKFKNPISEEDKQGFQDSKNELKEEIEEFKNDFFDIINSKNFINVLCVILIIISCLLGIKMFQNNNEISVLNKELSIKQEKRQKNTDYNKMIEEKQNEENRSIDIEYISETGNNIITNLFNFSINENENTYSTQRNELSKKYVKLNENKNLDLISLNVGRGKNIVSYINEKNMYVSTVPNEVGFFIEQKLSFKENGNNSIKYWFASVKGTADNNVQMNDYYPLVSFE